MDSIQTWSSEPYLSRRKFRLQHFPARGEKVTNQPVRQAGGDAVSDSIAEPRKERLFRSDNRKSVLYSTIRRVSYRNLQAGARPINKYSMSNITTTLVSCQHYSVDFLSPSDPRVRDGNTFMAMAVVLAMYQIPFTSGRVVSPLSPLTVAQRRGTVCEDVLSRVCTRNSCTLART